MAALRDKQTEERLKTISDRVKAHEMQLAIVQELYQVIITGNVQKGEPSMLENNRNTAKSLLEMSQSLARVELRLNNYAELDKRIKDIEERHTKLDLEKKTKNEEISRYRFYFITLAITNIVSLIVMWLKPS